MDALLKDVRACTLCKDLPLGPGPILQASPTAKILIAGQAPGRITHHKAIPFDDPSGVRLRDWMGVTNAQFYDASNIAILPMGFCFPGTGKGGDLPPRPECAPAWRDKLMANMPNIELALVIGKFAMDAYFPLSKKMRLTDTVKNREACPPDMFPLPHPSPRNNRWLKSNPWFERETLPDLKAKISAALT